ncbi:MAG TPA: hypothetical protein VHL52_01035 [Acidimicrobiia bacterium]|jgi:nitrate/nitrite transporter NarK|nr:hypothetical protein [Acidimicrobiia bacterium]
MVTAIVAYVVVGLAIGLIVHVMGSRTTTLAGMTGIGGAAGVIGGVVANLIFSDDIQLDLAGWAGSIILAIVAVLVITTRAPQPQETTTES